MKPFAGPKNRLWSTYRLLQHPFEAYPAWQARYGDPMWIPAINGDVVLTGRPELIKTIFARKPEGYGVFGADAIAPLAGNRSLLTMEGEEHRRDRKLLMPPFHGARMRTYAALIQDAARRHLDRAARAPEVRLLEVAQDITMEVILRAVLGVTEPAHVERSTRAMVEVLEAVHPAFLFAPFLQRELGGFGPYARFLRKLRASDALLDEQIEVRATTEGEDILSLMLASRYEDGSPMPRSAIRDELRTMLVAGHETTAVSLCFAVDMLYRHPDALVDARDDAASAHGNPDAQAKLPMVQQTIRETLRLRPVLTEVMRTLLEPMELDGLEVPAGAHVAACIVLAHRNPDVFPDPDRFLPSRFERRFAPHEYLPFGGGHRRCIGAAFAEMELQIVMATLLDEYEIELLAPVGAPIRRNVTMAPKGGVPVRIRPRARRAAA